MPAVFAGPGRLMYGAMPSLIRGRAKTHHTTGDCAGVLGHSVPTPIT
jgi:hypothetical protein